MYQPQTIRCLPKEQLPTMYDLPSEEIGDPGLPDQYHFWEGELLSETFIPRADQAELENARLKELLRRLS